ncbi:Cell cycle checkpoint control protein rad9b [Mortierella alpina]|nr:Cell cycle checkpoint control protein rad9b [Mortierella alpina]
MRAIIPSVSVKGFQYMLVCLGKIGDDVVIEARPDRLTLSTLNITRTAFADITFTRTFFESYHLDTSAEAIQHDAAGPFLRCSVLAKALVSACKIRGNVTEKVEKCCLFMNAAEGVGENCRLTIEIIFKHGFIKIHRLLYESCSEAPQIIDSIQTCPSSWRLPPAALMGLPENFSAKAEEITMSCSQEGIAFKTCSDTGDEDSGKKLGSTVVPMSRSVMESYNLQDEVEMTFAMKEFKAIISFALALRLPLEAYFDASFRPFLLRVVNENVMTAAFAIATIVNSSDIRERLMSEQAMKMEAKPMISVANNNAHGNLDLSQAENALFLDDDADWADALNDIEMEEAAAAAAAISAATAAGSSGTNGKSGESTRDSSAVATQTAVDAYEIEEPCLPPQRKSKRARFDFDDFD